MFFRKKKAPAVPAPPLIPPPVIGSIDPPDDGKPRKKILIIDDDPVILKALSFTLRSNGYKVVTAIDGSQAIGLMRDEEPDLMLVDVNLPPDVAAGGAVPWDGFQVTQWIRQMNGRVPTIVISGTNTPDFQKRSLALGAHAFLAKPIDNKQLLAAIAAALPPDDGEPPDDKAAVTS